MEESWIPEPKKENSISDPSNTPPLWRLQPHPPEKILIDSQLESLIAKGSPYPLDKFLVGFRGWIYKKGKLWPVAMSDKPWPQKEPIRAICNRFNGTSNAPTHKAPKSGCQCGIWCFKNPQEMVNRVRRYFYTDTRGCLGSVAIWGKVIEHKEGYRAEWAYPLSLETYGLSIDEQFGLADAYGVEIKEIKPHPEQERIDRESEAKRLGIWIPNYPGGNPKSGQPGSGT